MIDLSGNTKGPNPMYLLVFIIKSLTRAYPVSDLCNQQNWNTSERENIKSEGNNEQPTILSAMINSMPNTAHIIYNHISKNIIAGIYFKQIIAILWFFFKDFIY